MKETMEKAMDKLKMAFEQNPLQVIFVAGIAAGGAAKLLNAMTSAKNAKTWEKEVDRRRMMRK
jgi:hypothetical protein